MTAGRESDVTDVITSRFESSPELSPTTTSLITIEEVDAALRSLKGTADSQAQKDIVQQVIRWCTSNDLKMFINLLRHDLMVDASPKVV